MVDQLALQTIGILLTGLTVSIAAIYYTLTLRYTRRNQELTLKAQEQALETRQAQLFSQYHLRFQEEFPKYSDIVLRWEWKDYDDFTMKYGIDSENEEAYSTWLKLSSYMEGMGVIVKRQLIDPNLVDDLMSGFIVRYWEKHESMVLELRQRLEWPNAYEHIEYLYNVIKEIMEQQHPELKV